jgi:hypothetical protein
MKQSYKTAAVALAVSLLALGTTWSQTRQPAKSEGEIRLEIIKASVTSFKGSCPCPYSLDKAKKPCGTQSAYTKSKGAAPVCYLEDVTPKMVDEYLRKAK